MNNNKSSFPSGHARIVFNAALWNTFGVFKKKILLFKTFFLIALGPWIYYWEGIPSLLLFASGLLVFSIFVGILIFILSLFNLRIRKKYLKYKIRRQQCLKKYYKDPREHQKINEVIDGFQQHLRLIDEELQEEFNLGI